MQRSVFLGLSMVLLFVFCSEVPSPYNNIDAVSSASGNIQVTEGKAYNNYVILKTYKKDSYSFHFIGYGIGIIDSMFPDTLMVADTPRVVICTLTNLNANTTYNFIFRGEWPANPEVESHTVEGIFSTVPNIPNPFPTQGFNQ